ncbi:MAG TPA: ATP-dependent Clp protease ATP-binding subunit [Myxococcota bacterium]|nr:ATP-dependent Clp protease ATP-binding subunit [Myxococcota bacterium]
MISQEVNRICQTAIDIARASGKPFDSTSVLLAMFAVPCTAGSILTKLRITDDSVLGRLGTTRPEPPDVVRQIIVTAEKIADSTAADFATSVHLLLAVANTPGSRAARVISACQVPLIDLRTMAMSYLTDVDLLQAANNRAIREVAALDSRRPLMPEPAPVQTQTRIHWPAPMERSAIQDDDDEPIILPDEPDDATGFESDEIEIRVAEKVMSGYRDGLPESGGRQLSHWTLDPSRFPTLCGIGRNLTDEAANGGLDSVVGRRHELEQIVDILCKRDSNNPLLIGEPGVGKTALVEGLAMMIVDPAQPVPTLRDRIIVSISTADLVAGTSMRGAFAERMRDLRHEVADSDGRVILFIDEIHTIIGAGAGDGGSDAANDLKGDLARGKLPCIGATTFAEYQRHIQTDPALERRFQRVILAEPSLDEAENILVGVASRYEQHHQVSFTRDALRAAVRLTDRLIPDRGLPSKAIDLLDRAGAMVARSGRTSVDREDVVQVLSALLNLPKDFLDTSSARRIARMQAALSASVFGNDNNIAVITAGIAANWLRFGTRKPLGTFVFAGPPSSGKTTMVRELSRVMFGSEKACLEINLADFAEKHTLSTLIGAPPGYTGYDDGGMLAKALLKTPFLTIVWKNFKLAESSIQAMVATILAEGSITNTLGRRLDFRNTVHVLTLEDDDLFKAASRGVGFGRADGRAEPEAVVESVRRRLPADVIREVDHVVIFNAPDASTQTAITRHILECSARTFLDEHSVALDLDDNLAEEILDIRQRDQSLNIKDIVSRHVLRPATDVLVESNLGSGDRIRVTFDQGRFLVMAEPRRGRQAP